MKILVTGYYHRHNLGDDAFEFVIPKIVGLQHDYTFMCVDDLPVAKAENDPNALYDLVLVGPGDVTAEYFLKRVGAYLCDYQRGPVLLFGGGITWSEWINLGHLDAFDGVFLRNTTDLRACERRLGTNWVHFIPDVVFAMKPFLDLTVNKNRIYHIDGHSVSDTQFDFETKETKNFITEKEHQKSLDCHCSAPKAAFYPISSIFLKNPQNPTAQLRVLDQLSDCILHVLKSHHVTLVRFNNSHSLEGDDLHISQALELLVKEKIRLPENQSTTYFPLVVDTTDYTTPEAMLQCMSAFEVNVCMRFHSHVFSIVQQVPFVSLTLTRKVDMLMQETDLAKECGVKLERCECTRQPTNVPIDIFKDRFDYVIKNSVQIREKLQKVYMHRHCLLSSGVYSRLVLNAKKRPECTPWKNLSKIFTNSTNKGYVPTQTEVRQRGIANVSDDNETLDPSDLDQLTEKLIKDSARWWSRRLHFDPVAEREVLQRQTVAQRTLLGPNDKIPDAASKENFIQSTFEIVKEKQANLEFEKRADRGIKSSSKKVSKALSKRQIRLHATTVCERVCYQLTNQVNSPYLYGFVENMLKDPLKLPEYIRWLVFDFWRKPPVRLDDHRCIFLDYMKQEEFSGAHRSGWAFALSHLHALNSDRGVLFDAYLDRTFHWGCDTLKQSGILPYTQSWVGVLHHTPLEVYTDYNVNAMLRNPVFQASLLTCRGIYVLSETLCRFLASALQEFSIVTGCKAPPVNVLSHPTFIPPPKDCFSIKKFKNNSDRALVHIGAWLRKTFSLHELGLIDQMDRNFDRAQRRNSRNSKKQSKKSMTKQRFFSFWSDDDTTKDSSNSDLEDKKKVQRWQRQPHIGYVEFKDNKRHRLQRWMLKGKDMSLYLPPENLFIGTKNPAIADSDGMESKSHSASDCNACRHACHSSCGDIFSDNSKIQTTDEKIPWRLNVSDAIALSSFVNTEIGDHQYNNFHETKCTNQWVIGLRQFVDEQLLPTVKVIDRLENAKYDALLQENIVFLDLLDASACNTLLECFVRNTPILINPIPAVVEVLGPDYPFYYNDLEEALFKSRDITTIAKTHRYMKELDKTQYSAQAFIEEIQKSEIYKSLLQ